MFLNIASWFGVPVNINSYKLLFENAWKTLNKNMHLSFFYIMKS